MLNSTLHPKVRLKVGDPLRRGVEVTHLRYLTAGLQMGFSDAFISRFGRIKKSLEGKMCLFHSAKNSF